MVCGGEHNVSEDEREWREERNVHEEVRESRFPRIDRISYKIVQILWKVQSEQYCCDGGV